MALTPEQWEARKSGLGGSDIAAILGMSKWGSSFSVWSDKMGFSSPSPGNKFTEAGTFFEGGVADWYASQHPKYDVQGPYDLPFEGDDPILKASPDRIVYIPGKKRHGLEIKTASAMNGWGPSGSSGKGENAVNFIPDYYLTQCMWYMEVLDIDRWDLAVFLFTTKEFREYTIYRDKKVGEDIVAFAKRWWQRHIIDGVRPSIDESCAAQRFIESKNPVDNGNSREATDEEAKKILRLREIRDATAELKKENDILRNQIRASMGPASYLRCEYGVMTYKSMKKKTGNARVLRSSFN